MIRLKTLILCVALGPLALLLIAGCGNHAPTVSGTVTYNGTPVENGTISFRPAGGTGQSFATAITDGKYTAGDRVTAGPKIVVITGNKITAAPTSSEEAYKRAEEARKAGKPWIDGMEPTDYIAEDAEGNSKEVEITPGAQTLDFAITGAPIP
jgi:hypothetical protein